MSSARDTPEEHRAGHEPNNAGGGLHDMPSDKEKDDGGENHSGHGGSARMYAKFGVILLVSLGLMWVLSMSMVRSIDHFYFNLSNFWMALLMVGSMAIVMVIGMWSMFKSKKANIHLRVGDI